MRFLRFSDLYLFIDKDLALAQVPKRETLMDGEIELHRREIAL
jgi:hypothetical protein